MMLKITFPTALILSFGILVSRSYGVIPTALGWYQIPNTQLQSVCPSNNFGGSNYAFANNCDAVTTAWNSGAFDSNRNRLIIWGGGHSDYSGNEIYALDLKTEKMVRVTDPGAPAAGCPEAIAGGAQPNSRHTYDGISFMPNADRLFVVGGSLATCGGMSEGTWTFDFKTNKWQDMKVSGSHPSGVPGIVSAFDPNTGKVFVHDDGKLYAYDIATNNYAVLLENARIDYHMTAVIDPKRKKMVILGGGEQWIIDISGTGGYKQVALGSTGGGSIIGTTSPGLAYDAAEDKIVAWQGGNSAYALNLDTKAWTAVTFTGGPGSAMNNGTIGRWDYVPSLNAFVVVNSVDNNAYTLRWSTKSGVIKPLQGSRRSPRTGAIILMPGEPFAKGNLAQANTWDMGGRWLRLLPNPAGRAANAVRILTP